VDEWYGLPEKVVRAESINIFKGLLGKFLRYRGEL
jgi:hypothetical protein